MSPPWLCYVVYDSFLADWSERLLAGLGKVSFRLCLWLAVERATWQETGGSLSLIGRMKLEPSVLHPQGDEFWQQPGRSRTGVLLS